MNAILKDCITLISKLALEAMSCHRELLIYDGGDLWRASEWLAELECDDELIAPVVQLSHFSGLIQISSEPILYFAINSPLIPAEAKALRRILRRRKKRKEVKVVGNRGESACGAEHCKRSNGRLACRHRELANQAAGNCRSVA